VEHGFPPNIAHEFEQEILLKFEHVSVEASTAISVPVYIQEQLSLFARLKSFRVSNQLE
jgi:hypothetical protein